MQGEHQICAKTDTENRTVKYQQWARINTLSHSISLKTEMQPGASVIQDIVCIHSTYDLGTLTTSESHSLMIKKRFVDVDVNSLPVVSHKSSS